MCTDNQNEQPSVLAAIYDNDKSRADVNKRDQDGMTPLMLAAMNGHDVCAKILLEKGADVKIHVYGFTALHFAAKKGYHRCIEVLLSTGFNVNDVFWYQRETPLTLALQSGNMESLEVLLRGGADVNQWKRRGDSAFIIAIRQANNKQVERLIESGAFVNEPDFYGRPPLIVAIEHHCRVPARELDGFPDYETDKLARGMEMVKFLIESGADVNQSDNNGATALIIAIKYTWPYMELINYLLASGADVNHLDHTGKSPLAYGIKFDAHDCLCDGAHDKLIPALLRAGARINTQHIPGEDTNWEKSTAYVLFAAGEGYQKYENLPDYMFLPAESIC